MSERRKEEDRKRKEEDRRRKEEDEKRRKEDARRKDEDARRLKEDKDFFLGILSVDFFLDQQITSVQLVACFTERVKKKIRSILESHKKFKTFVIFTQEHHLINSLQNCIVIDQSQQQWEALQTTISKTTPAGQMCLISPKKFWKFTSTRLQPQNHLPSFHP